MGRRDAGEVRDDETARYLGVLIYWAFFGQRVKITCGGWR